MDKFTRIINIIYLSIDNYLFDDWQEYLKKHGSIDILTFVNKSGWKTFFSDKEVLNEIKEINDVLTVEVNNNAVIYPHPEMLFTAFNLTPLDLVKVVVIGQDPYPSLCSNDRPMAMGLSFSIPNGQKIAPSLNNIIVNAKKFNHIKDETLFRNRGNLSFLAIQGVFMINATMTIKNKEANSHFMLWDTFTSKLIQFLSDELDGIVFLSWGRFANKMCTSVDTKKHFIITSSHPSPQSCRNTFIGPSYENKNVFVTYPSFESVDHFGLTNKYLIEKGKKPITFNNYLN